MWRVAGSCLSWLSTVQPSMSGRKTSSETAVGRNSRASVERLRAAHGDQHLEALVVRQVDEDARVVRVVLDDQQDGSPGCELVAIVGDLLDRRSRPATRTATSRAGAARRSTLPRGAPARRRAGVA